MSRITSIITAAALGFAGAALADTRMGAKADVDANKDGKITKAEAKSNKQLSARFGELDINKDGNLDTQEYAAFESTNPPSEAANPDVPDTVDDSVPGNKDLPGPNR